jgi:hypothetical protein
MILDRYDSGKADKPLIVLDVGGVVVGFGRKVLEEICPE